MRALSIRQPWAWAIVQGLKDIENRTWNTKYRGPFLVHASKKLDPRGIQIMRSNGLRLPETFETGGFVGMSTLISTHSAHPSHWFEGPFGFYLAKSKTLQFVPFKGRLGLFDVNYSELYPPED